MYVYLHPDLKWLSFSHTCQLIKMSFCLFFQSEGNKVDLTVDKGIDDFMNLLESSALSKNPQYYGSLHNEGHVSILAKSVMPVIKNAIDRDAHLFYIQ